MWHPLVYFASATTSSTLQLILCPFCILIEMAIFRILNTVSLKKASLLGGASQVTPIIGSDPRGFDSTKLPGVDSSILVPFSYEVFSYAPICRVNKAIIVIEICHEMLSYLRYKCHVVTFLVTRFV